MQHFSAGLNRTDTIIYSVERAAEGSLLPSGRGTTEGMLQQLANLTGGRWYSNGEVEKAIVESLEDARGRYQLAYAAPQLDGKYHKLRLVYTRKGVGIETERGHFANQP